MLYHLHGNAWLPARIAVAPGVICTGRPLVDSPPRPLVEAPRRRPLGCFSLNTYCPAAGWPGRWSPRTAFSSKPPEPVGPQVSVCVRLSPFSLQRGARGRTHRCPLEPEMGNNDTQLSQAGGGSICRRSGAIAPRAQAPAGGQPKRCAPPCTLPGRVMGQTLAIRFARSITDLRSVLFHLGGARAVPDAHPAADGAFLGVGPGLRVGSAVRLAGPGNERFGQVLHRLFPAACRPDWIGKGGPLGHPLAIELGPDRCCLGWAELQLERRPSRRRCRRRRQTHFLSGRTREQGGVRRRRTEGGMPSSLQEFSFLPQGGSEMQAF
jgi:hypothetical protein